MATTPPMRRCIIFIATLFSSLPTLAQKIHFADTANLWGFGAFNSDFCVYNFTSRLGSDTAIGGNTYYRTITNCTLLPCPGFSPVCIDQSGYFVREDTLAHKVYFLNQSIDAAEHVLYDYNLQLSDTIVYHCPWTTFTDSVARIDSTLINGVYHKVWFLMTKHHGTLILRQYTVVEGLGCLRNPYFPAYGACTDGAEWLLCFSQTGVYPAFTSPLLDCSGDTSSFTNSTFCSTTMAVAQPQPTKQLSIYPNPAFDEIVIDEVAPNSKFIISDLVGRQVMYGTLQNGHSTLAVNCLKSGSYQISIIETSGWKRVMRFVKE